MAEFEGPAFAETVQGWVTAEEALGGNVQLFVDGAGFEDPNQVCPDEVFSPRN